MTGPTEGNSRLFKCPGARSPYLLLNGSSWKLKFGCSRCLPPRPCPWGGPAHTKVPLWLPPPGRQAAGQGEELQAGWRTAGRIFRVSWILYPMAPNPACPSVLPILPVQFPDPLPLGVPSQGICTTVSPLAQPKTQKTASPHQHTEGKVDSVREGRHRKWTRTCPWALLLVVTPSRDEDVFAFRDSASVSPLYSGSTLASPHGFVCVVQCIHA